MTAVTWARGVARSVKLAGEAWTKRAEETRAAMAESLNSMVRGYRDSTCGYVGTNVGGPQRRDEVEPEEFFREDESRKTTALESGFLTSEYLLVSNLGLTL